MIVSRNIQIILSAAWFFVNQPALAAHPAAEQEASTAFRDICATGPLTPAAVFDRAAAHGWRKTGDKLPKDFDRSTQRMSPDRRSPLLLSASSETSNGERRDICAIAIGSPVRGLESTLETWLGFRPYFAMGRSATFMAIRSGDSWRSGNELSQSDFEEAKSLGEFYTIIVGDRGKPQSNESYPAQVILMRVQPTG